MEKNICIACKEEIQPGAKVCPHCSKTQSPSKLHLLGEGLKWAAGFAVLFTLIISVSELNKIMQLWLQKEQAASEYAEAAQLLVATGDHVNAQVLLKQAAELNPASVEVRNLRIELAQQRLRTFMLLDRDGHYMNQLSIEKDASGAVTLDFKYSGAKQAFEEINIEDLVQLFARGVVSANASEKATLLAHLGWMDLLRQYGPVEFDVDKRFQDALKVDPDNFYANAMYSTWLISPRNRSPENFADKLKRSREHFRKALVSDIETAWTKTLWMESLLLADGLIAEQERLRAVQTFKDTGDQLNARRYAWSALKANFINSASRGSAPTEKNEQRLQFLFSAFPIDDLFNKLHWLSSLHYGCIPGPGCEVNNQEMQNLLYISGRMHEVNNSLDKAVEAYRLAQTEDFRKYFVDDVTMQHLELVLLKQAIPTRRVLANWNKRAGSLQERDVILTYQGQSITDEDELRPINAKLEPDQQVDLTVLRKGEILDLLSEPIWGGDVVVYVIPESFLKAGKADELRVWLTNSEL